MDQFVRILMANTYGWGHIHTSEEEYPVNIADVMGRIGSF